MIEKQAAGSSSLPRLNGQFGERIAKLKDSALVAVEDHLTGLMGGFQVI